MTRIGKVQGEVFHSLEKWYKSHKKNIGVSTLLVTLHSLLPFSILAILPRHISQKNQPHQTTLNNVDEKTTVTDDNIDEILLIECHKTLCVFIDEKVAKNVLLFSQHAKDQEAKLNEKNSVTDDNINKILSIEHHKTLHIFIDEKVAKMSFSSPSV